MSSTSRRPFVDPELLLVAQHTDALLTDAEAQDAAMVALRGTRYSAKSVRSFTQEVPTIEVNLGDSQPSIEELSDMKESMVAAFDDKGVRLTKVNVVPSFSVITDKVSGMRR